MGCGASAANRPSPDSSESSATVKGAASPSKYSSSTLAPPHNGEDDEGPATMATESALAPVRRTSLITVTSTRGVKASSSTTTPKLTSRATEPKLNQFERESKVAPPEKDKKEKSGTGEDSTQMFIFGDFNVDPGDVKRQRMERLNRIARPVATLRRKGSNATDGSTGGTTASSNGGAGGSKEPLFMLNDFVINVLDHDVDDAAPFTFLHEIKVPVGFKPLRSFDFTTLIGCPLRVKSLALMADEHTFLMASIEDSAPLLLNSQNGNEVSCFVGHSNAITYIAVSRDGKLFATCSRDNTVCIWDAPGVKDNAMRKQQRTLADPQGGANSIPLCAAFNFDSSVIVVGHQDRMCRAWDLNARDSSIIAIMDEHKGVVVAVSTHPRDNVCVSGSGDRAIFVWRIADGVIIRRLPGHEGPVLAVHYSTEGDKILSCDSRTCKLWKVDDGSCAMTVKLGDLFPNANVYSSPAPTTTLRRSTLSNSKLADSGSLKRIGNLPPVSAAIANALMGAHSMAVTRKTMESNAAASNAAFTGACFAPGMLANSYVVIATTLNFVVIVSLPTGQEELRLPTKGPVFSMCQGRLSSVMVGDMFGNVYRLEMRA